VDLPVTRTPDADSNESPALADVARRVRRHVVRTSAMPRGCHLGGSLSCVDILVALYYGVLRHDPEDPDWPDRDVFIFSKGHAAPALYAVLAERGYFPLGELSGYSLEGSRLLGHPTRHVPGVEFATGSVGHGLSLGVGVAIGFKRQGLSGRRVIVLLGDGELQEGSVWEAAMSASHYRLDNLHAIVDRNHGQNDGDTEKIMSLGDIAAKWRAFGWRTGEVDGHDIAAVRSALEPVPAPAGTPSLTLAHTRKGRGLPGIEGDPRSHYMTLSEPRLRRALHELRDPVGPSDGRS
jgi:transketolase